MKHLILIFIFYCLIPSSSYAFAAGTLVKTPSGYQAIETLQINDTLLCFDENHSLVKQSIISTFNQTIPSYIQLYSGSECICLAPHQQLYLANSDQWIAAKDIRPGTVIVKNPYEYCMIDAVRNISYPLHIYELTVQDHHNFCISRLDIRAHNLVPFIAIGFSWAFGLGAIEFAGITLSALAAGIGISAAVKHHQKKKPSIEVTLLPTGSPGSPLDPNDKKRERDEARAHHQPLTNKQARQLAKELGYKEDANPPFDTKGQPAFRKGNDWISPDRTAHKGGIWKRFTKDVRKGTYNATLTIKIGD